MEEQLFTSESVTEGHPDKMCDQIADAVLDACLREDPHSRVACEALTTTGLVVLAGEITTSANLDFQTIVRDTIKQIGYDRSITAPAACWWRSASNLPTSPRAWTWAEGSTRSRAPATRE